MKSTALQTSRLGREYGVKARLGSRASPCIRLQACMGDAASDGGDTSFYFKPRSAPGDTGAARLSPMQDWRAYRARLVALEKSCGLPTASTTPALWSAPPQWPSTPVVQPPPARSPRPSTASSSDSPTSSCRGSGSVDQQCRNGGGNMKSGASTVRSGNNAVSSGATQRPFTRSIIPPARPASASASASPAGTRTPTPNPSSHPALRPSTHPILRAASAGGAPLNARPSPAKNASAASSSDAWAHSLAVPEVGCLLVARREGGMAFFNQAVVLVTSHDAQHGTVGLVLNKPSQVTVSELQVTAAASGFQSAFASSRLVLGGPVHLDHVTLVHRFKGAAGSTQLAEGLHTGGLPSAVKMVQAGLARPSDFLLVLGVSGWAPGQLTREVAAGFWHCVSAHPNLVLPPAAPCPVLCTEEVGAEHAEIGRASSSGACTETGMPALHRPLPRAAAQKVTSKGLPEAVQQVHGGYTAMWSRIVSAAGL